MAKHKFQQTLARLLREIVQLFKTLTGQFVRWFLRNILVTKRWQQGQAGFVLPTIAFMLMVVALVVAAILFRTFTRTDQLVRESQQQAIVNAATPAIDRAKSKLEYLFTDPTLPRDIPTEISLEKLLLDKKYEFADEDPVNLPGITGLDVDRTTAWKFKTKTNNQDLTTIYAIVSRAERGSISVAQAKSSSDDAQKRADAFVVRNGPLVSQSGNTNPNCPIQVGGNPVGWFNGTSSSSVYKNFQVYAVTVPTGASNAAIATIEYQQDRSFNRANKWGAWFRTDMEIAPGPTFNWNGAIHSQGNIVVRSQDGFRSFLISSANSCVYNPSTNSQITLRRDVAPLPGGQFLTGQIRDNTFTPQNVSIDISPTTTIGLLASTPTGTNQSIDSVDNITNQQMTVASDPLALHIRGISQPRVASNPSIWQPDTTNFWNGNSQLTQGDPRIAQAVSCAPYVDDTYRADNRYGPKPSYNKENFSNVTGRCEAAPETNAYGSFIANTDNLLVSEIPQTGDLTGESVGLDGYWERRARFNGLRVIVGQRLELGNPFGWNVDLNDDDPAASGGSDRNFLNDANNSDRALYSPPNTLPNGRNPGLPAGRENEGRQYTTLRDNLAAVQATAVYHHTNQNGDFPIAFIATTAHPGTTKTIQDSITFKNPATGATGNVFNTKNGASSIFTTQFGDNNYEILSNFFIGEGTNGWEFSVVPGTGGQTEINFINAINDSTDSLRIALNNLAHFAGDPEGYFPPMQENGRVHPYPKLTMWGNFSNLRETLRLLAAGNYTNLSIADKSNLHTAAGTLGMLAYNISYLQEFDYTNPTTANTNVNKAALIRLDGRLAQLSDRTIQLPSIPTANANPRNNGEVEVTGTDGTNPIDTLAAGNLPPQFIDVYQNGTTRSARSTIPSGTDANNPPQAPPPEAFIAALEAQAAITGAGQAAAANDLELFKLLHLKEQVERDRRFGFRNTPTTGTPVNQPTPTNSYQYKVTFLDDYTYAGVAYDKDATTGVAAVPGTKGDLINIGCDVSDSTGNNYFGFGQPTDAPTEQRFIRLATSLCPTQPKFPSLYYLFPKYSHDHDGDTVGGAFPSGVPAIATDYLQPGHPAVAGLPTNLTPETYIVDDTNTTQLDSYIATANVNLNYTYAVLGDTNNNRLEDGTENGIESIALLPRTLVTSAASACTGNNWCVPAEQTAGANPQRANPINDQTNTANATANVGVSFLDKGIFDGREMMNVRLLDIDLDLLRRSNRDGNGQQDVWLPISGLVYAFREDAVREDAIARPAVSNWTAYQTDWQNNDSTPGDPTATFRMRVFNNPADPPGCQIQQSGTNFNCTDPAANWGRGISPKPVDYYADPDRRPHGFRLQNGVNLIRPRWSAGDNNNLRGLSFISDNSVYIQGNFNPHLPVGTTNVTAANLLEEFTNKLGTASNYATTFYNRTAAQLDTNRFAQLAADSWRPAEIIADAVGILSSNFCDGTIQGGIRQNGNQCANPPFAAGTTSSYQNSHFNGNPANIATVANDPGYVCENPFDIRTGTGTTPVAGADRKGCNGPIKVFRNGDMQYNTTANTIVAYNNYLNFASNRNNLNNTAGPNWVNAVLVSGIIPSRSRQSNGGLVNFPRFLESWDQTRYALNGNNSRPLWFSGAMIQLNFSNYATAPWDQDAWETSQAVDQTTQNLKYYTPPRRTWGYDVGLQYAPAGPVARRMVTPARDRSELYREPPANDPYICKLRAALDYPCN